VSHQIDIAVLAPQLEISVVRCEPLIDDTDDDDAAVCEQDGARRFLSTMPRVTFDTDREQPLGHGPTVAS